jgi:hypothetical protein
MYFYSNFILLQEKNGVCIFNASETHQQHNSRHALLKCDRLRVQAESGQSKTIILGIAASPLIMSPLRTKGDILF